MTKEIKVTVIGAAGGIGQPLSLLLKSNNAISHLSLYDIVHAKGVAADLSHINTASSVTGFVGESELTSALKGADVVVIPAGMPRKPGMTRDDLFAANAKIISNLARNIATCCPDAHVCVITNPVNATVPIVVETLKQNGVSRSNKVYGITTLDSVRASRFLHEVKKVDPVSTLVPIVGGHSGPTIVPLMSQVKEADLKGAELEAFVKRVQYGGDEVVQAKEGAGSATLSMAYAGARFVNNLIQAMQGARAIEEAAYVQCNVQKEVSYFACKISLGPDGFTKAHGIGEINEHEQKLLAACIPELQKNIAQGEEFVRNSGSKL